MTGNRKDEMTDNEFAEYINELDRQGHEHLYRTDKLFCVTLVSGAMLLVVAFICVRIFL